MKLCYFAIFISVILVADTGISAARAPDLTIGAFNIQIFGKSKIAKQDVVDQLVKIISRYDVVLIQEIRDISGTAIVELVNQINEANRGAYSHVVSERLGRTSAKEQYCFIYKHDYFAVQGSYVYDDTVDDVFEREPFNVYFRALQLDIPDLLVSGIHVKPADAVVEISKMVDVYEDIVERWENANVLIMGDLNAACSYVTAKDWPHIALRNDDWFQWYIDDDDDTTVQESRHCAYDRFVAAGSNLRNRISGAAVFDFKREYGLTPTKALAVSDHYPIELKLRRGIMCHDISTIPSKPQKLVDKSQVADMAEEDCWSNDTSVHVPDNSSGKLLMQGNGIALAVLFNIMYFQMYIT